MAQPCRATSGEQIVVGAGAYPDKERHLEACEERVRLGDRSLGIARTVASEGPVEERDG